jgi:hypothetical protein
MDPVNLAYSDPVTPVIWIVKEIYKHPVIGIPAAVLVIGVFWLWCLFWLRWSKNRRK